MRHTMHACRHTTSHDGSSRSPTTALRGAAAVEPGLQVVRVDAVSYPIEYDFRSLHFNSHVALVYMYITIVDVNVNWFRT